MVNDCNGFGEDWNEDESGRKNVEVDGGDLGETVYQLQLYMYLMVMEKAAT